ncbi:MAG: carbohydrate ABC transporter permease [Planctomycetota bacterium]|jgi:multiple sugar transport system permease protein
MEKNRRARFSLSIEKRIPVLFVSPCVAVLLVVSIFPFLYSLWLSFNKWELGMGQRSPTFAWLNNYAHLFTDNRFWDSIENMAEVLIFGVGAQFLIGLGLALLLNRPFRGRRWVTTLFLLPMMISPVVVGCNWKMIYNYSYGPLNHILRIIGIGEGLNWLGSTHLALPSIIIADSWEWMPFMMIVLLAGLQSIPVELYEAAKVDGASRWQEFWYVTLPSLKTIIIIAILIRMMDTFKLFDLVVLLTQGGPASASETISYYNYLTGFKFFNMGYAASLAYIQLAVIIVIATFFLRFLRKGEGK